MPTYDDWKLATPPEYEWPDEEICEDCGHAVSECACDDYEQEEDRDDAR